MRCRSGPEHRLPGPPPTHPFSRSTMSNIDPTREHPREAGLGPRVERRAYTLAFLPSQTLCYEFSAWQNQRSIHALSTMIVGLEGEVPLRMLREHRSIRCLRGSRI